MTTLSYLLDNEGNTEFYHKAHCGRQLNLPPFQATCTQYSHQDYIETEMDILKALDWNVLVPTPLSIVQDLMILLPPSMRQTKAEEEVLATAGYITELAVSDYDFAIKKPSSIALAAMTIALEEQQKCVPKEEASQEVISVDPISHFKVVVGVYLGETGMDCASPEVQWCRERLHDLYRRGMEAVGPTIDEATAPPRSAIDEIETSPRPSSDEVEAHPRHITP